MYTKACLLSPLHHIHLTRFFIKLNLIAFVFQCECVSLERFRAGHFTCKNTDWEKWREPIRKVEPETTDWALHARIPVPVEPSHFLTASDLIGLKILKAVIFPWAFLFFLLFLSFFVSGRWPDLWVLPRLHTCFQFICYLVIFIRLPPPLSSTLLSFSSSLSQGSSWKDSAPPSRLFTSK